jgi:hypothetical protein
MFERFSFPAYQSLAVDVGVVDGATDRRAKRAALVITRRRLDEQNEKRRRP